MPKTKGILKGKIKRFYFKGGFLPNTQPKNLLSEIATLILKNSFYHHLRPLLLPYPFGYYQPIFLSRCKDGLEITLVWRIWGIVVV